MVQDLCVTCCMAVQVAEAVHYFGKAQRSNHGVRLAKQHGMDTELLDLALKVHLTSEKYFGAPGLLSSSNLHHKHEELFAHVAAFVQR